jgi:hypothetical protein
MKGIKGLSLLLTLTISLFLIAGGSGAQAQDDVTLDRVFFVSSPKWYLLRQKAVSDNSLWFRKFAFPVVDGKQQVEMQDLKNIMSYVCKRDSKTLDYVIFHLPKWVHSDTIDHNDWISRIDLRIAIDKSTFTAVGEYRDRELSIDLTREWGESLLKLLISENIAVEFGPHTERINLRQLYRTPTGGDIVGFFDDAVPMISSALGGGKVDSLETETMLQKCIAFKRSGKY